MSKYEIVRNYYRQKLWPLSWVENAVGKWITADEFQKITGKEYPK
nr:MAG TPA: hypothetical protein [Caudoviricetes sp.]